MINDYFKYFMYQVDDDRCGIRKDIAEIINADIEKYRNFSVGKNIYTLYYGVEPIKSFKKLSECRKYIEEEI